MTKHIIKFPEHFLWGSATAAHQIEGNNTNSDWWAWEHSKQRALDLQKQGKNPELFYSGIACDSYNRYEEDFALAKQLNQNSIRFSVEWARLEPKEGLFAEKEFEHYEKVFQAAKFNGLTIFLTLHHFTNPIWFAKLGGFSKKENIKYFLRYAEKVVKRFSEYIDFVITFNEPEVYSSHGFLFGKFPPNKRNPIIFIQTVKNIIRAHNLLYFKIKQIRKIPISMAYHLSDFQPSGVLSKPLAGLVHFFSNEYILKNTVNCTDFLGVNYYFHHHLGWLGFRKKSLTSHGVTDLGWGIHPEGLERVLLNLKKYNKDIYITENGLADSQDLKRKQYIKQHLFYTKQAMEKGVKVKGYLHWSLLDNFEWNEGFGPRFGLLEVVRENNLERKVRQSALYYAEICKNNFLDYNQ